MASDDAAGLAISEKMRAQIRGLNQASRNIQDGISLLQTADGALQQFHDMIARIRELTIQSANDTNAQEDREKIQAEVDHLVEELDELVVKTEFNNKKILLNEKPGKEAIHVPEVPSVEGSLPSWVNYTPGGYLIKTPSLTVNHPGGSVIESSAGPLTLTNAYYATLDFSALTAGNVNSLLGDGFYHTCCSCNIKYSFRSVNTPDRTLVYHRY